MSREPATATFYFDLGSPYAYLVAERVESVIPAPVRWQPVLLGGLFKLNGRSSWALGDDRRREAGRAEIERRAGAYELPAIRWPDPWPSNYLVAMRVATFAFTAGRGREFTLCAFRDAFQRGRDLSVAARVLDAAEHAGLDRHEAEAAAGDPADQAGAARRHRRRACARRLRRAHDRDRQGAVLGR